MEHDQATQLRAAERYLLGELSDAERKEFEEHFFVCPACEEEVGAGIILQVSFRHPWELRGCLPTATGQLAFWKESRLLKDSSAGLMQFYSFNEEYVQRLAGGDSSIGDHFAAYFGELLSIKVRGRVRSRDALEDVSQETFARVLQVLRQKGGLEHPERLGAFVNSVCNNVLFEKFREAARHSQMNEGADWPDGRIDLEAPLINQERKRLVESVLAELPKRDRELLRMIFLEEAGKAEACERLGVGRDYLRVLLHRALSRFREQLAKGKGGASSA